MSEVNTTELVNAIAAACARVTEAQLKNSLEQLTLQRQHDLEVMRLQLEDSKSFRAEVVQALAAALPALAAMAEKFQAADHAHAMALQAAKRETAEAASGRTHVA